MARDVFTVPVSGAGVEWKFSISGRVIIKHRNRLSLNTIQDLLQYKRWIDRHEKVSMEGKDDNNSVDKNSTMNMALVIEHMVRERENW